MNMQLKDTDESRFVRLEQYRFVLLEAWQRSGITNKTVAAYTGRGTSIISKVKNGRATISSHLHHQLIDLFELDRIRLFLAVEMMGEGMLYYDPMFRNVCHASTCFVRQLLSVLNDDSSREFREIFASFSETTITSVANQASFDVTERIFAVFPKITTMVRQSRI